MAQVKSIAMHPGTGTETVKWIMENLGVKVQVITQEIQLDRLKFDGLILLGGSDINPFLYGEKSKYCVNMNRNRDVIEWRLVRKAMTLQVPIFGICRGHQLLSVAHGGSLYQDMYKQRQQTNHGEKHRVKLTGEIIKHAASDYVNSLHHQAVKSVPDGFRVVARAEDGIVEAIYKPGMLGVQWHPELMYSSDARWGELFHWFANGFE